MMKKTDFSTLKKVMDYIGRNKFFLLLSIILSSISVILTLYIPQLFGDAIDLISENISSLDSISKILVKIGILILITAALTWILNTVNNRITYHIVADIRKEAFAHLQKLPLSYLDSKKSGDIVSRMIADVDQFADGLLMGLTQLFTGIVTIIVTLIFMIERNIYITLLVALLTPLSFGVAKFIADHTHDMFKKQSETRGRQTALIDEMIGNEKVVKAFGYEERAKERFEKLNNELENYSLRAVFFSSITNPSTRFVNSIIYAAVAMAGAFLVIGNSLTVGGLSVLLSYASQYTKPFNEISSVITELQNAFVCAERIFELLEEKPQSEDPQEKLIVTDGAVKIENVSFGYRPDRILISDLDLDVKPGMRVAIVGPTGCGKTTMINLLMRFYDVSGGKISVDDQDISEVNRGSLRAGFGMVLQDTWIRNASVRDNIRLAKPEAEDEEIIEAAKKARSYGFIRRLPQGLDTILTEDTLSQGQKQLLCITRVMLSLPPMLILDEATSSIDTRTEVKIQEAFARMMEGRTSFIVAHRLSTIQSADIILVMKDGHIIEKGNHQELLDKGGFYHDLYYSQFQ